MELREFLVEERQRAKLTQRDVAKLLGVGPSAVAQWEKGDTKPEPENFVGFCALVKVDPRKHFGKGTPYPWELVENPEELVVLEFWRRLAEEERAFYLSLLQRTVRLSLPGAIPAPIRETV